MFINFAGTGTMPCRPTLALLKKVAMPNFHLDLPGFHPGMPRKPPVRTGTLRTMTDNAPYHAHIYYEPRVRDLAEAYRSLLCRHMKSGDIPELHFVGQLKDGKAGPHPIAQFEVHFTKAALPTMLASIRASGFRALVHPLTDDDLADHTRLAHWIGTPLELDLTTLDPPGRNQGVARFGKSDF
jgi:aromatic ring-cleaving dioxygenase